MPASAKRGSDRAKEIGSRIVQFRKYRQLNQPELGKMIGVSGTQIGHYERGRDFPDIQTIEKMASIFGVNPCKIVGWCDD